MLNFKPIRIVVFGKKVMIWGEIFEISVRKVADLETILKVRILGSR
jgi:hypothetical protein